MAFIEQPHHDLAADGAKAFGLHAEGLVQRHQLGVGLALVFGGIRVVELLAQREQHVVGAGITQGDGGLAEAHAGLALVQELFRENVQRGGTVLFTSHIPVRPEGLPDDTLRIQLEGTGGQSFGAFLAKGITLYLIGDANDYTGKGLSGGRVVVRPSLDFRGVASQNIIVGNTVMYGATTGEAFFAGVAGERFAVRLSGATAVVEGTGDHGCEYMTGGTVAVLGKTGRNFGAGMSGGIAYVYDEDGEFASRCNTAMVSMEKVLSAAEQEAQIDRKVWHRDQTDEAQLKKLLEDHFKWTGSQRARELLDNWATARAKFVKVFPNEYKRALGEINARKAAKAAQPVAA